MIIDMEELQKRIDSFAPKATHIRAVHSRCGHFSWVHLTQNASDRAPWVVFYNGRMIHEGFGSWADCMSSDPIVSEKVRVCAYATH